MPSAYYQEVGNEGFIQAPIGAGPFKLIEEIPGDSLRFEAFEDYHRPVHVKDFTMRSVQEATTRLALLEAGDVDIAYNIAGELIPRVEASEDLVLVPTNTTAVFWLEFPHQHNPDNPFSDVRVREAVGLALDRQSISDAETSGHSKPANYWIPPNILLAPPHAAPEEDLERARALMAEAGYADGFEVEWLSPIPNYFSLGERVISQIGRIGITARLQTMERGTFFDRLAEGDTWQERNDAWGSENQILLIGTGTAGAFIARYDAYVGCEAPSSRMCGPRNRRNNGSVQGVGRPRRKGTIGCRSPGIAVREVLQDPDLLVQLHQRRWPPHSQPRQLGRGQRNLRQPTDGVLRTPLGKLEAGGQLIHAIDSTEGVRAMIHPGACGTGKG